MTCATAPPLRERQRAGFFDAALCILFLTGIYLGIAITLPGGVPIPCVLAGVAGLLLVFRHAPGLPQSHAVAGLLVLLVAALSILSAADYALLPERFKGFVQFSYSLVIGYAFFLSARNFPLRWLAGLFLAAVAAILAGCLLEIAWPGFKQASDLFRGAVFDSGVYDADLRDLELYGRVRPKLFTSEPSFLTFNFTLFAFCWYVLSRLPGKTFVYLGLLAVGYLVMRGPTLVLGALLVPVYEVFLGSRRNAGGSRGVDGTRALIAAALAGFLAILGLVFGWEAFALRIEGIVAGRDPSFFSRVIAPAAIAFDTLKAHPFAGVGLTGWEALDAQVAQLYATTDFLSIDMLFDGASKSLTNYFWALWIFLGLFWGTALLLALSGLLRALAVPSLWFCWSVWIVFGQAAGGFVGPRTWAVLFLAAAISIVHERARQAAAQTPLSPAPAWQGGRKQRALAARPSGFAGLLAEPSLERR
ncbi:MAG: hypothetical protein WD489_06245 [Rhodovibrionaceae bacterium]